MKSDLLALLILSVTCILLAMIAANYAAWIVATAVIIVLTVLILAVVNQVEQLPDILKTIIDGLKHLL